MSTRGDQAYAGDSREPVSSSRSLWIFSLSLFLVSVLLALPVMDTAMRYMLEETLRYSADYMVFLIPVLLASFAVQLWLFNQRRRLRWLLPVLSAVLIAGAEIFWIKGGWDRLGSMFCWSVGFPMMLGSGAAVLLAVLPRKSRAVQLSAGLLVAAVVVLGIIFWPRYLSERIELFPESSLLCFEPGGGAEWLRARDGKEVMDLLEWAKVTPCLSEPAWDSGRGVMLRLDQSHILIAYHHDTPYIYEYAGALEDFDGGRPKWKVFGYPALYGELRASANRIEG